MANKMIVFSGAPATGKDTVTDKICAEIPFAVPFIKFRGVDPIENKPTYFNISKKEFENKIQKEDFIQHHERYGRYYGIAKDTLSQYFKESKTPIIHAGRLDNFKLINSFNPKNTVSILLWCELPEILRRLEHRHPGDKNEINARYKATLEEYQEWLQNETYLNEVDLIIKNTDLVKTSDLISNKIKGLEFNYNHEKELEHFSEYLKNNIS
jgi:guanylate kinase